MIPQPNIKGSKVLGKMLNSSKRIIVNRGGTRSTKTYSAMQLIVMWLLWGNVNENWNIPTGVCSVVRKTLPSLKASALRDFKEILWNSGCMHLIKENKTEITFDFNGRMVEFFSVDNQQKVRSRKRNILICIEANELDFKNDFNQLAFRTTDRIILDFNPDDEDIWINTELEQKRAALKEDVEVIVSNYTWNPFLEQALIDEIEYLKETDPELWEVYGRGNYGKVQGLIYPNATIVKSMPENITIIHGLDFGFNDPQTLVRVGVNDPNIYVQQLYYERFKTNQDFINRLPDLEIDKKRDIIYADPANPGKIQEIFNAGYRGVKPAKKGQGSIDAGITKLKKYKWHIVAGSEDIKKERKKYKWLTDKNGEPIEGKPIDKFNHAMDAIRYAIYTHYYYPTKKRGLRRAN